MQIVEIIVSLLGCALIYYFLRIRNKPKKRDVGSTTVETGIGGVEELTKTSVSLLKRKGLEGFLLKDFSFSMVIEKDYLTSPGLLKSLTQQMVKELTVYLKLPPIPINAYIVENHQGRGKAGEYAGTCKEIRLFVTEAHEPEQVAAVLCHEVTHYFMQWYGLDDPGDIRLNERRTDVIACLIGFSEIMVNGYMVMSSLENWGTAFPTTSSKVGYLNATECKMVCEYLLEYRRNTVDKKEEETGLAAFYYHLKEAQDLLEQINRIPKEDYQFTDNVTNLVELQSMFLNLETGVYAEKIRKAEGMMLEDQMKDALLLQDESLLQVCNDLRILIYALQRKEL